ncbi:glycosyltransferase [Entomomonas asaccharolytica]|uniref:Glycosyltransferase family 2 protein n=1 Tax=Entomomonas asaccharolytica TaxID=2785331 RepID=A0A974RWS4_9GAMM|nr:glycosyltransferase family A protein [Entomomonas asaccharolytica]QQP85475.1 glycosyltransferase family 2 protein [Entomomonas asaccharolytica]
MIGITIPVHNEEARLYNCLISLIRAINHPDLNRHTHIVIVLDSCTDGSLDIVKEFKLDHIICNVRNVGLARRVGVSYLIQKQVNWLAFTDADTIVSDSWLVDQLALNSSVVCGTVEVSDWEQYGEYAPIIKQDFFDNYNDKENHRHVHGANLGLTTEAYLSVGGFQPLKCSEDQALIDALIATGVEIAWTNKPRVYTSCRQDFKAQGGFGDCILSKLNEMIYQKN